MADRWLDADTDDFSNLPEVAPPTGVAPMRPARHLSDGEIPPNLPVWPSSGRYRNARPDMTHDPRQDDDR